MKIKFYAFIFCFIVSIAICNAGTNPAKKGGAANTPITGLNGAYGLIQNKGQVVDQYNNVNKDVLYLYSGRGLRVQLKQGGFSYEVNRIEPAGAGKTQQNIDQESMNPVEPKFAEPEATIIKTHRVDIVFAGAAKAATITPLAPMPDAINYCRGEAGTISVRHYQKVVYSNIYPGIDVEFVVSNDSLKGFKYNFILRPGADINAIKLLLLGASATAVNEQGHILIQTAYGTIDESIPYSFQPGNVANKPEAAVHAEFYQLPYAAPVNAGQAALFGIRASYNPAQSLIIDPAPWATYYGGSGDEFGFDIAIDNNSNIFIYGYSSSATGIATSGAYQTIYAGNTDAMLLKFNNAGQRQWATYYGGSQADYGYAMLLDNNNNIFVTGSTSSPSGIATTGTYQTAIGGLQDVYISRFNSLGQLQWGTYLGGSGADIGYDIAVDNAANIFVTGQTSSAANISSGTVFQSLYGGAGDGFVAKFSGAGAIVWSSYLGGTLLDNGMSMALDGTGNAYITGSAKSTAAISTAGAHQTVFGGGTSDAYLAKINPSGSLVWATYMGGSSQDAGNGLTVSPAGTVIITGNTSSADGIATSGAYQQTLSGAVDAFLVRFNSAGVRQWGTYFGSTGTEVAYHVAFDVSANILMSGYTSSSSGIATSGAYQGTLSDTEDGLIASFTSGGTLTMASYFGGNSGWVEHAKSISDDGFGGLYVTGMTHCDNNVATPGAFQTTWGGGYDAWILAILPASSGTPVSDNVIASSQSVCSGSVPARLTGSTPGGGNGVYAFTWLSSVSGPDAGYAPASGVNSAISYSPPATTTNTWYKRYVVSGLYADSSAPVSITVGSARLNAGFTVNKAIQCIRGNSFIFTDTTTSSVGPLTRYWTFGNGDTSTSPAPAMSYNFNVGNSYLVKLIVSANGACTDSAMQRVYLINNPVTGAITGNISPNRLTTQTYSVPHTIGSAYHWFITNGTGSSLTNSINIRWNTSGLTDLKVLETTGGGCAGDTVTMSLTVLPALGIEPVEAVDSYVVFPNPARGNINVQYNGSAVDKLYFTIFDGPGRLMLATEREGLLQGQIINLDVSALVDGFYYMHVYNPSGSTYTYKIQVVK